MAQKVSKKIIRKSNTLKTEEIVFNNVLKNKKSNIKRKVENPLATAVWLVNETSLTFKQIADFCELYEVEVSAIANNTFAEYVMPVSPIDKYLSREEIKRCELDENAMLSSLNRNGNDQDYEPLFIPKQKTKKYTPLLQRRSKADAILWIVTFATELSNRQIIKLIGTTENTIESIKNRSHRSMSSLTPKDPVIVGLCTQQDFDSALRVAKSKIKSSNNAGS